MEESDFTAFMRKGGRKKQAAERVVASVKKFELFLREKHPAADIHNASPEDLDRYVECLEKGGETAKAALWAIRYYYAFQSNQPMEQYARVLREQRIVRKPFPLRDFRGGLTSRS